MRNVIEEMRERGLISQPFGNIEEIFSKPTTFYIGIDPTADSLGVHHLVGLMAAKLLQSYGHKPIILVGGATCAIGDPSGKTEERKAISMEDVFRNVECVKKQISKIVDFSSEHENGAIMVDNYDWYNGMELLDFMRMVGKKVSVNYLMAKENVKKRLEREGSGISVQEFLYGTLQGYDFVHLYKEYGCKAQIAGTDNLSNMKTGQMLVHKILGQDDVCGITWDLVTCADGRKFGKTEGNSVWLDEKKTSPYDFYQFWVNQSDEDAERFLKLFTTISLEEIQQIADKHRENPSSKMLQQELAKFMTCMVHSEEEWKKSVDTANLLFGNVTADTLSNMDEKTFLTSMRGVATVEVSRDAIDGKTALDVALLHQSVKSKADAKKLIKANGFSINKQKVGNEKYKVTSMQLINGKYMLLQKGKKDYCLVVAK